MLYAIFAAIGAALIILDINRTDYTSPGHPAEPFSGGAPAQARKQHQKPRPHHLRSYRNPYQLKPYTATDRPQWIPGPNQYRRPRHPIAVRK